MFKNAKVSVDFSELNCLIETVKQLENEVREKNEIINDIESANHINDLNLILDSLEEASNYSLAKHKQHNIYNCMLVICNALGYDFEKIFSGTDKGTARKK